MGMDNKACWLLFSAAMSIPSPPGAINIRLHTVSHIDAILAHLCSH